MDQSGKKEYIQITEKEADRIKGTTKAKDHIKAKLENVYMIPCGRCEACKQLYIKNKANRILLDWTECGTDGHFLTLTYDNEHLPISGLLKKEDITKYIKELQKIEPNIKYYAVGEYGSQTLRPHYHAIIWNEHINFGNLQTIKTGKLYRTFKIANENIWKKGEVSIARITPENINYCCGYCQKKLDRTKEEKKELLANGITPEFNISSRAIGYNYYQNHLEEILNNKGTIWINGEKITTDRSFKKFLEKNELDVPDWITTHKYRINIEDTKQKYETKEKFQKERRKEKRE